jgi:hypothetical protein
MILSILFGLAMAYAATIHFRRGNLSPGAFAFWLTVWVVFLAIAATAPFWPKLLKYIPLATRLFDVVVAGLLIALAVNSFRNALFITKLERKLGDFIADLAVKEAAGRGELPDKGEAGSETAQK